jgi:hypothetical protein
MAESVPVDQCDVDGKEALKAYREKEAIWYQWLRTDEHHPIWPQIYSMVVNDITFRTLAYAADHDAESGLHNNLIRQAFTQGYLATQGLAIRRLTERDRNVISLQRDPVDLNNIRPTMDKIAAAQKAIIRAAEAVSAYILHMPSHMVIVPVYQFSKFWRFEQFVSSEIVKKAVKFWNCLEDDRNSWTQDVYGELLNASADTARLPAR